MITETCLLGHGIPSVSSQELVERWPREVPLAMVLGGRIELLSMREFVDYRHRDWPRFDWNMVDEIPVHANAYLTASGTMKAAEFLRYKWAISCGLGGICPVLRGESVCPDLHALGNSTVKLMATAFKDMMNYEETFALLRNQSSTYVFLENNTPGYLFNLASVYETFKDYHGNCKGGLFLRGIPIEKRLRDLSLLYHGIEYGQNSSHTGKHFHPAVNGFFDHETDGYSSRIQFEAILSNVEYLLVNKHIHY